MQTKQSIQQKVLIVLLVLVALAAAWPQLSWYLYPGFNLFLTLFFAPFILFIPDKTFKSARFGLLSLLCFAFYPVLKIQSCFFLGLCFLYFFIIESWWGKLNNAAIFWVALLSPMSAYVIKIFGFPVRLKLTEWAAKLFQFLNVEVVAHGNNILINDQTFIVEPACTGLKLVSVSLLTCLAILTHTEKRKNINLRFFSYPVFLVFTCFLVIAANLIRIITLILFQSKEGTLGHEIIGIVHLIIYVVVPLYFIIPFIIDRFKFLHIKNQYNFKWPAQIQAILLICIFAFLFYFNLSNNFYQHPTYEKTPTLHYISGFESEPVDFGGTKLTNESALVYYKPSTNFWTADHNPNICWKGSGYTFKTEYAKQINGIPIYAAELVKGEEKLFTAWWFTNGETITNNQLSWRWQMMKGAPDFALVNVTCSNETELEKQVSGLLKMSNW